MPVKNLSSLLFAVFVVFMVLALVTLIPYGSKMVSDLGYFTLCPFAPYSTLTLLFLGGVAWAVRQHLNAQRA
jgi:hypothetical protein